MDGDAASSASCKEVVDACMAKYGRIDILVDNVGRVKPGGPAEMSEEVWDRQMHVNLKSVYLYCHLLLPTMERQERRGAWSIFLRLPGFDISATCKLYIR